MMRARHLLASLILLTAAAAGTASAQAGEWVSYRDAYRAMVRFEKYGGPKNLLINELQVLPREPGSLGEGAQLSLSGKTVQLNLPLDVLGRTVFPLQKAAYDENAALTLNRNLNRKGTAFTVRPLVALAARADGQYEAAELRAGCAQALAYARWLDAGQGARQCVGVRFVFGRTQDAGVRVRHADGLVATLPVQADAGEAAAAAAVYRFGAAGERAQVITVNAPTAILPLID